MATKTDSLDTICQSLSTIMYSSLRFSMAALAGGRPSSGRNAVLNARGN